jgi:two-component system sensor histidine kinase YesM
MDKNNSVIEYSGDTSVFDDHELFASSDDSFSLVQDTSSTYIGRDFIYSSRELSLGDYTLAVCVRDNEFGMKLNYRAALLSAGLILLIGLAAYLLYRLLSKEFVRPISQLHEGIMRVADGSLDVSVETDAHDEIGDAIVCFNQMVHDMRNMITQQIEVEHQLSQEQIRVLQLQLNPHFICNTLGMIRLMAMQKGQTEISDMLERMVRLLRTTIHQLSQEITLAQEIDNLRDYIYIQQRRYPDCFDISLDISDETLNCELPALTLQPLLENAIMHGVLPTRQYGSISVASRIVNQSLILEVTDNGVGIDSKTIANALSDRTERTNIGLYNVNRILHLRYGEEYGISIESEPGAYTRVTVHLPIKLAD